MRSYSIKKHLKNVTLCKFWSNCSLFLNSTLTLSWRRPLSYGNQSIDLLCKSNQWPGFYIITASVMKELNISYILYLCFYKLYLWKNPYCTYEKIYSIARSQQPYYLANNSTKTSTHTLESLHVFLESTYELVSCLKKFEKVYSSSFVCGSSGIPILIKCNVAMNSISIRHQNSIAKTPFTHFLFFFFFIFLTHLLIFHFPFSLLAELT